MSISKADLTKQVDQYYKWAAYEDGQPKMTLENKELEPWEVREWGGFALRDLMQQHFDDVFKLSTPWVSDESANVQRGALLGCKFTKKYATPEVVKQLLKRIESFMTNGHKYMIKNCGAFVVNELGGSQPGIVGEWLATQATLEDEFVRVNVAKAFTKAYGKNNPEIAVKTLKIIKDDERKRVKSAITSALTNLYKKSKIDHKILAEEFPVFMEVISAKK